LYLTNTLIDYDEMIEKDNKGRPELDGVVMLHVNEYKGIKAE